MAGNYVGDSRRSARSLGTRPDERLRRSTKSSKSGPRLAKFGYFIDETRIPLVLRECFTIRWNRKGTREKIYRVHKNAAVFVRRSFLTG